MFKLESVFCRSWIEEPADISATKCQNRRAVSVSDNKIINQNLACSWNSSNGHQINSIIKEGKQIILQNRSHN